ncbi:hypothetical protein [Acetobacter sp. LMG 32666]|uniref:hypothetical protein n=1 Tax=Acetobacter sp. LMG 32666 TaxID=2959295 RepID=UPI0030C896D7
MVYRIDDVTAVSALPALPTDNIGEPGFFTGGSTTGQSPTRVRFWWLNMVQEELINIAQAAGIVFDKTKNDQCITAIKQLISSVVSSAVMGAPAVMGEGDVAGKLLYYAASQKVPVFVYGTTTVALVTTTALVTILQGFLPLAGGNVTGSMDWGSKTAAATLTHRYWSAGPPAEGDATPDVTLTISGGTPGTPNKGSVAVALKELDFSRAEQVLVPDVTDFATKQALSAKAADNRYPASVPEEGQARVTSLVQDDNGRTLSNGTALANLADLPTSGVIPATDTLGAVYWTLVGNILTQSFFLPAAWNGQYVPFPTAYRAGTIPQAVLSMSMTPNNYTVVPNYLGKQADGENNVTNLGFTFENIYGIGGGAVVQNLPTSASIWVRGEV